MKLVPDNEMYTDDKRNVKKLFLATDAICLTCGAIFNSNYEDQCIICSDSQEKDDDTGACTHKDFITGKECVSLRTLLDFHLEDLRSLCELHDCSTGSRSRMTINIMKKLYDNLDKRINENLVRKMIIRNRRRFWYCRDIESAVSNAKRRHRLTLIDAKDCIETNSDDGMKQI